MSDVGRMRNGGIRWAPRLSKEMLRRLYQSDAAGLLDEALLDEVGTTLYQRCRSILDVKDAREGRVHCLQCAEEGIDTVIIHSPIRRDAWEHTEVVCPRCGWRVVWGDFVRSYKRHQLNAGGAVADFERYVREYPGLRSAEDKMLAVDRLIHAFHYSFFEQPNMPSRPVGPNLINGRLGDVIEFLNELAAGERTRETRQVWDETLARYMKEYLQDFVPHHTQDADPGEDEESE
jgi:hypothetical protein